MPFGLQGLFDGLILLALFALVLVVGLMIARLILIRTVRLIRREWTRAEPPRG